MPVNTSHKLYDDAFPKWQRVRDCYDGSDAVKAKGIVYLPMLASHVKYQSKYSAYKLRALFFNGTARTVDGLAGAVFQRAPMVTLPAKFKELLKDVTLTQIPAELFGLLTMRELLKTGRYGVLVELSETEGVNQRPYFVGYEAENIVSWLVARDKETADEKLVRVVLREYEEVEDPKDPFKILAIEQYRVLYLDEAGYYGQIVYRKAENSQAWTEHETFEPMRRGERLTEIPFVFIGTMSLSPHPQKPPLVDLSDVNLSHYRTMADLEQGRHYTALPQPWVSGHKAGAEPLIIGGGVAWTLDKDGQAGMLEFSGAGLASLQTAEQDKRAMMATLGARLLEGTGGVAETATSVNMRHSGEQATLRTIAATLEQALTKLLAWFVWWISVERTPNEVKVKFELNKDFFTIRASSEEVKSALALLMSDKISYATFYELLQRGGWTRENVTAEQEKQLIDAETPAPVEPSEDEETEEDEEEDGETEETPEGV